MSKTDIFTSEINIFRPKIDIFTPKIVIFTARISFFTRMAAPDRNPLEWDLTITVCSSVGFFLAQQKARLKVGTLNTAIRGTTLRLN